MGRWSVIGFGSNPEVGARLVHTAGLMMTLATFVQQNPVVVQLQQASTPVQVQMVTDTGFKWWLSSLAPWVGPLLSGVVSIYVAWKVFQWQGRKEREQWVRDQKKAAWKDILKGIAEVQRVVRAGEALNGKNIDAIRTQLEDILHEISVVIAQSVLLEGFRIEGDRYTRWMDFKKNALALYVKIDIRMNSLNNFNKPDDSTVMDKERTRDSITEATFKLKSTYGEFLSWLQDEAAKDLM